MLSLIILFLLCSASPHWNICYRRTEHFYCCSWPYPQGLAHSRSSVDIGHRNIGLEDKPNSQGNLGSFLLRPPQQSQQGWLLFRVPRHSCVTAALDPGSPKRHQAQRSCASGQESHGKPWLGGGVRWTLEGLAISSCWPRSRQDGIRRPGFKFPVNFSLIFLPAHLTAPSVRQGDGLNG